MPIQITITADTALEAHEEIAALAGLIQAQNVAYTGAPEVGATREEAVQFGRCRLLLL